MRFLVDLLVHSVSLVCAAWLVPGVRFGTNGDYSLDAVVFVALVFGLVNAFVKPVMAFATCGLYVLTLGLFHFVLNALMLQVTAWLAGPSFHVDGFGSAFVGGLVISVVGSVGSGLLAPSEPPEPPHRPDPPGVITIHDP